MDIMVIVYAILAYLIGSIPSGLIIGKTFFNTDVRQYGSKNIGATNTYRVIGLKAALPVFLCDALKGAAGVVLLSSYGPMYMILGGILAMMGHNWSIFLGFKGGRGVATGLGVLIALSPLVALIAFLVWGVIALGFNTSYLRLYSALILATCLVIPTLKDKYLKGVKLSK